MIKRNRKHNDITKNVQQMTNNSEAMMPVGLLNDANMGIIAVRRI